MIRLVSFIFMVITLSGCAASSVFAPYPAQAAVLQHSVNTPTQNDAIQSLSKQADSADAQLYLMEQGRLAQLANDFTTSQQAFTQVLDRFEQQDAEAKIDLSRLGANLSSSLTNDNVIPYQGYGYERIFTHLYQAYNYLAQQDNEAAMVELRRLAAQDSWLEQLHDAELANAEQQASEKQLDLQQFDHHFEALDQHVANTRSAFQSAYAFYFSALIWEAMGNQNDAAVDYRKALRLQPDSDLIQQSLRNLSRPHKQQGQLIVLIEQGFVPARQQVKIPIPVFTSYGAIRTWIPLAFPLYQPASFEPSQHYQLNIAEQHKSAELLTDVSQLAVKALREKTATLLLRQIVRAVSKYQLNKQAKDNIPFIGNALSTIYNEISEQADLRNWLTLPHYAYAQQFRLAPGTHQLSITTANAVPTQLPVTIQANHTQILRLTHVNGQWIAQPISL